MATLLRIPLEALLEDERGLIVSWGEQVDKKMAREVFRTFSSTVLTVTVSALPLNVRMVHANQLDISPAHGGEIPITIAPSQGFHDGVHHIVIYRTWQIG